MCLFGRDVNISYGQKQMPKVLKGHKHMASLSIIEQPLLAELLAHT